MSQNLTRQGFLFSKGKANAMVRGSCSVSFGQNSSLNGRTQNISTALLNILLHRPLNNDGVRITCVFQGRTCHASAIKKTATSAKQGGGTHTKIPSCSCGTVNQSVVFKIFISSLSLTTCRRSIVRTRGCLSTADLWSGTKPSMSAPPSKEGNGPWRLISTPKSEFLEKIRRIKIIYAQFIFICAVFNYNPAFPTKSANLGLTMHISLASSRDRANYHAHATILMRTSPRSNHE